MLAMAGEVAQEAFVAVAAVREAGLADLDRARTVAPPDADDLHEIFKALSNPTRLRILGWLRDPAAHFPPQDHPPAEVGVCVKHIQNKAGVSQSTASQFMATLQRAGLVTSRRIGQWTHYQRDEKRIAEITERLRSEL
jgi:ArsR family transcriptional regulator